MVGKQILDDIVKSEIREHDLEQDVEASSYPISDSDNNGKKYEDRGRTVNSNTVNKFRDRIKPKGRPNSGRDLIYRIKESAIDKANSNESRIESYDPVINSYRDDGEMAELEVGDLGSRASELVKHYHLVEKMSTKYGISKDEIWYGIDRLKNHEFGVEEMLRFTAELYKTGDSPFVAVVEAADEELKRLLDIVEVIAEHSKDNKGLVEEHGADRRYIASRKRDNLNEETISLANYFLSNKESEDARLDERIDPLHRLGTTRLIVEEDDAGEVKEKEEHLTFGEHRVWQDYGGDNIFKPGEED